MPVPKAQIGGFEAYIENQCDYGFFSLLILVAWPFELLVADEIVISIDVQGRRNASVRHREFHV